MPISKRVKNRLSISPLDLGAKPGLNPAAGIEAAIATAAAAHGWVEVDLGGQEWILDREVSIAQGSRFSITNGVLKAGGGYNWSGKYALKSVQGVTLGLTDFELSDVAIDMSGAGALKGGGVYLDNYLRIAVDGVRVLRFGEKGFVLRGTLDSHECLMSKCWAMHKLYGDGGEMTPNAATVGFDLGAFDNTMEDCVSYYTGVPLTVQSQFNTIRGCHLGTGVVSVTPNAPNTSFVDNYFDMASLIIQDPWLTKVQGNRFLHLTEDAATAFIELQAMGAGRAIKGLMITGNVFTNLGSVTVESIKTGGPGTFDPAGIIQCDVSGNAFQKAKPKATRVRRVVQNNVTGLAASEDMGNWIPFGAVQDAWASVRKWDGSAAHVTKVAVSGNVVTAEYSSVGSASVTICADVNTGAESIE